MINIEKSGFFNPIRFPEGKHPEERLHWLGYMVEPYFDLRIQKGFDVVSEENCDGIPLKQDTRKLSAREVALKVLTIALKILSYFTLVIPLAMLIGKAIYRFNNSFFIQPPVDPKEHQHFASQLIKRFSSKESVNAYSRLSKQVEAMAGKDFSSIDTLREFVSLHQELTSYHKEISNAVQRSKKHLSDDLKYRLQTAKTDIEGLQQQLNQRIDVKDIKDHIVGALTQLQENVVQQKEQFNQALKAIDNLWKEQQKIATATGKDGKSTLSRDALYQGLIENIDTSPFPDHQPLADFADLVAGVNEIIPNCYNSEETCNLIHEINEVTLPHGIKNFGATCYLNSVLQTISANPGLYELLKKPIDKPEITQNPDEENASFERRKQLNDHDHTQAEQLRKTLRLLITAQQQKNELRVNFIANRLVSYLFNENLIPGDNIAQAILTQNDAQEVMHSILSRLNILPVRTALTRSYQKINTTNNTEDIFLTVPVKDENGPISFSLQGLLDHYFEPKQEGDPQGWEAAKNIFTTEWTEEIKLLNAPNTLLLHLGRFQHDKAGNLLKVNYHVSIPVGDIVDLTDHFKVDETESARYQVVNVVQHSGTLNGGHYTANVKKGPIWFHCNDRSITAANNNISCNGYIYILKKMP